MAKSFYIYGYKKQQPTPNKRIPTWQTKKFLNQVFNTIYDCKVAVKFTNKRGVVLDFPASEARMFYWLHNMKKREMGDLIDECGAKTLEDAVRGIVRAVLSMWGGRWDGRESFLLEFKA